MEGKEKDVGGQGEALPAEKVKVGRREEEGGQGGGEEGGRGQGGGSQGVGEERGVQGGWTGK